MNYLGTRGYTIFKSNLSNEQTRKIKKDLIVKPFSTHSQEISYPIFRESDRKFYLPRYYGIEEFGEPVNKISKGNDIDLDFKGTLRDYQYNIIDKYIAHVGESGGGLLDVEPGKGKTVMALNIISRLKKKTLVIVHKTFLMNQWIERIEQFLPDAKVGRIQGDVIDTKNKDIVLGMLQSLSNKEYPDELWAEFGLCVFDECHHLSAEVFSNVMIRIVTNYNLGLSGTMTRKDGLSKVFKYFIGPVVHKEKTDVTAEVIVKSIMYENDTMFDGVKTNFKGEPLYSCLITRLDDTTRNQMISNIIKRELELNSDQQIMVLAHTKSLLQNLYKLIESYEPSIGYYLGGMKEEQLKESETKKIILGTYAMASEGLDIKTLTTLVLATPKSDVCQSVGRILRSNHAHPLVIDILDEHPMFESQYSKRVTYYNSKYYQIQEYKNFLNYMNDKAKIYKKSKESTKTVKKEVKKVECLIDADF
jgi:superfamily II DNA or RNA helicase